MRLVASLCVVAILFVGSGENKAFAADRLDDLFNIITGEDAKKPKTVELPPDGIVSWQWLNQHGMEMSERASEASEVKAAYGKPSRTSQYQDLSPYSDREILTVWYYDEADKTRVYIFGKNENVPMVLRIMREESKPLYEIEASRNTKVIK